MTDTQSMTTELTQADRELLTRVLTLHIELLEAGERHPARDDELAHAKRLRDRLNRPEDHRDPDLVEEAEDVLDLVRATMYPQAAVRASNLASSIEEAYNND